LRALLQWLLAGATAAAIAAALLAWPLVGEVETGRTPEYPDLKVREFAAPPDRVSKAVETILAARPGWEVVGSAHGPLAHTFQAVHAGPVPGLREDVSVRIAPAGGKTRVSVRSASRIGPPDFGQNARNVRNLLAALDAEIR
jgi:uncharacterized protein (DUF1499 family)